MLVVLSRLIRYLRSIHDSPLTACGRKAVQVRQIIDFFQATKQANGVIQTHPDARFGSGSRIIVRVPSAYGPVRRRSISAVTPVNPCPAPALTVLHPDVVSGTSIPVCIESKPAILPEMMHISLPVSAAVSTTGYIIRASYLKRAIVPRLVGL